MEIVMHKHNHIINYKDNIKKYDCREHYKIKASATTISQIKKKGERTTKTKKINCMEIIQQKWKSLCTHVILLPKKSKRMKKVVHIYTHDQNWYKNGKHYTHIPTKNVVWKGLPEKAIAKCI